MQGLKNDFIIVDARKVDFQPTVKEIVQICDRRIGVGGDELVILVPVLLLGPPIAGDLQQKNR